MPCDNESKSLPCHRESADTGSARKQACWIVMLAAAAACFTAIVFLVAVEGSGLSIGSFLKGSQPIGNKLDCNSSRRGEKFGFVRSILFVHIPKAGGTTVQAVMEKWATPLGIPYFNAHLAKDRVRMPTNLNDVPAIYAGHDAFRLFSRNKAKSVDGAEPLKIVTLRDPVSRFISHYDFVKNNRKHRKYKTVNELFGNETLQEILEGGQSKYCRQTNPNHSLAEEEETSIESDILQRMMHSQLDFMCGSNCQELWPEQKLEEALKNLEQCDCIAVTEEMDDLLDQMRYHINWVPANMSGFPHVNDARWNKSHISDEMRNVLKDCMQHDFILYERAVELARHRTMVARHCKK